MTNQKFSYLINFEEGFLPVETLSEGVDLLKRHIESNQPTVATEEGEWCAVFEKVGDHSVIRQIFISRIDSTGRLLWINFSNEEKNAIFVLSHNYLCNKGYLISIKENILFYLNQTEELFVLDIGSKLAFEVDSDNIMYDRNDYIEINQHPFYLVDNFKDTESYAMAMWQKRKDIVEGMLDSLDKCIQKYTHPAAFLNFFNIRKNLFEDCLNDQFAPACSDFLFSFELHKEDNSFSCDVDFSLVEREPVHDGICYFREVNDRCIWGFNESDFKETDEPFLIQESFDKDFSAVLYQWYVIVPRSEFLNHSGYQVTLNSIIENYIRHLAIFRNKLSEEYQILQNGFSYGYVQQEFLELGQ